MANPIEACLRRIFHTIPEDILNLAFKPKQNDTLDHLIHENVIHDRILFDCNLVGGKYKTIQLDPSWIEPAALPNSVVFNNSTAFNIYRVPAEAREHRNISSVIELRHLYMSPYLGTMNTGIPGMGGNSAGALACQALEAQTRSTSVPLPTPILVSGHQVKLIHTTMPQIQEIPWILMCRLNYDAEFTNLNGQGILPLVELTLCAVKAYIYNELVLKIDNAFISGGQALGKLKDIVESYADQNDRYLELLREFNGGAVALDVESRRRRIMDMI